VTITVTNRAHSPLVPHFYATPEDGIASSFWSVRSGPRSLAPGATATYAITPARRDLPELASTFWIEAVTADPETFSAVQVALPTAP
jgi:hypothetical protein